MSDPSNTMVEDQVTREDVSSCHARPCWLDDRRLLPVLCIAWFVLGIVLLSTGPFLNSHETYVAQIARQTLREGHWAVPRYLDAPFLVKPPLTPWLAAVAGYILPAEQLTGLPVSTAAARLPSLLAVLMTIVVIHALACSMYGRRVAFCATFVYATSAGALVFALNATAEAELTFFCTWAYAEFWWSRQGVGLTKIAHQVRFYIALGLAMMTKAPMPLMVVAVPLAVWWWTEQSTHFLADHGLRAAGSSIKLFGRSVLGRTRLALTDLGVWWGIPVVFGFLLAWIWAVSFEVPYVWKLWHTEYLDRLDDQELWARTHGPWYYIPLLLGFTAPWLLSLFEGFASPFLEKYRQHRRPLLYAWYWATISLVVLASMNFKKDYYLVPILPACALLLGPVLYQLFFVPSPPPKRTTVLAIRILVLAAVLGVPVGCYFGFREEMAGWSSGLSKAMPVLIAVAAAGAIALAARLFIVGRKPMSFCTVGLCGFVVFSLIWIAQGITPQLQDQAVLVSKLKEAGVGENEKVYWADSVPDGRLTFYCNRRIHQLGDPFALRAGLKGEDKDSVILSMAGKVCKMLEGERVYFVFTRDRYSLLTSMFRPKATILFEVDRVPKGRDEKDWLVVTNK